MKKNIRKNITNGFSICLLTVLPRFDNSPGKKYHVYQSPFKEKKTATDLYRNLPLMVELERMTFSAEPTTIISVQEVY